MFETSLIESTTLLRTRIRWPAAFSIAIQAAVAAVLLLVPLLHTELGAIHAAPPVLFAPSPRVVPPPVLVHVEPMNQQSSAVYAPAAPIAEAQSVAVSHPSAQSFSDVAQPTSFPSTISLTQSPLTNLGVLAGNRIGPAITVAPAPTGAKSITLSSGVSAGLLLAPIQSIYPAVAKATHTEGTVTIHAIISREGRIESAVVTSGPAMLQSAALQAVRMAHYRPYMLNGQPTQVDTTFTINFKIGN